MIKKRYVRNRKGREVLNIWPSFTDLMANAFMIISLFLLLALFKSSLVKDSAEATEKNQSQAEKQVSLLQSQIKHLKSAPPIVVIQDSGEYQFESGSAGLSKELKDYITNNLVNKIERISQQKNLYVVEIIGHTDGQVNFGGLSNLDEQLEEVAKGKKHIDSLKPGSNADLGLMRALEVVKQLQKVQQQTAQLKGVQFRAYSAAQLQLPSGEFAEANRQPDANRRRIEIRFSPLGKAETIK
ncbi:hypothetical protein NIES4102_32400 [Chondrocystis sp. NIES-4102]|nr:hypothetical protein NIES4102_32400 [Chondrocystis sp. NIES-4102]